MMEEVRGGSGGVSNPGFIPDEPNGNITKDKESRVHAFGIDEAGFGPTEMAAKSKKDRINEGCSLFGFMELPLCSKIFLTAPWVLVFLCWASTIQGMVINGFVNVVISTIEKRFGLKSTETGLVAGSYDIGSMLAVIPISYFGGRLGSSKPRYISFGLFAMGCGSLLFSLPHFITGPYLDHPINSDESGANHSQVCSTRDISSFTATAASCAEEQASQTLKALSSYKFFFFFGQMLHGVGAAALITLGTTLLDESVSKKNSPMYIGIFQTMFVVGPAIGFMMGGRFLSMYTDFNVLSDSEFASLKLTEGSPLWVGAWWLGFVIAWLMAWACSFVIGLYPATLPGASVHNEIKASDGFGKLKDLPKAFKALFTNPTYLLINCGGAMDGFSIAGLSTFMPKYMQSQFGLTAGLAAIIVGAIVVPAGGGGTLLGGYVTRRFRLSRSGVLKMWMYCQLITVPMVFGFLLTCPDQNFSGVNVHYTESEANAEGNYSLDNFCNQGCGCSQDDFDPVCGADNKMYYNPCFAGCMDAFSDDGAPTNFTNCQCINSSEFEQIAVKEHCDLHCVYLYPLIAALFVNVFFTFMSAMPNVVATLRSVEPVHRSLALGIESIFLRVMGTIPGPILFGALIDQTCTLWQQKECQEGVGNCLFYDNYQMGVLILSAVLVVKLLGIVFFAVALYFSKRSHIPDEIAND